MQAEPVLSVVLPSYNEADRIAHSIERVAGFLSDNDLSGEVIVVDDGSLDATAEAAREAGRSSPVPVRVVRYSPNRGKGYAVRTGLAQATGRYVGFTDADLAIDLQHITDVMAAFEAGADVVIGSKWARGAECLGACPLRRRAMSRMLNLTTRLVLGLPFTDTQCGFKFMTKRAAEVVVPRLTIDGFGFDMELLFVARMLGHKIVELPVRWQNPYGTSSVHPLRNGLQMLREVLTIRLRAATGRYRVPAPDSPRG